jgi:hypothetical protein
MNVGSITEKLMEKVTPFADSIGQVMGVVCSIGALLYIGSKLWKSLSSGESVEFLPLLRPFVVAFLALNFSVVKRPVDFLVERVELLTYGYFEKQFGTVAEQAARVRKKVEEDAAARKKAEKSAWDAKLEGKEGLERAWEYAKEGANVAGKVLQGSAGNFLGNLSKVLVSLLYTLVYAVKIVIIWYYKYVSIIYRSILGIFGPVAFAVAVFPGFKDGITNWLSKYVAICLWPVVFGVLNYLITSIQVELICSIDYSQWWSSGMAEAVTAWQCLLLIIVEVATYLTVPAIVSWLIPNGDASGALGGMKSILSGVMAGVGAAVGMATGGVGGKAMGKKIASMMKK